MERKKASEFSRELLNLFDQYVHGELRRAVHKLAAADPAVDISVKQGKKFPIEFRCLFSFHGGRLRIPCVLEIMCGEYHVCWKAVAMFRAVLMPLKSDIVRNSEDTNYK